MLFSRSTPSYGHDKDEPERAWDESLDANDPGRFTIRENSNVEDEEFVI